MIKNTLTAFGLSLLLASGSVMAQDGANVLKRVDDANGIPSFVQFEKGAQISANRSGNVLKTFLKMNGNDEMRALSSKTDKIGFSHEKYQQYYKGVKVEYATYTVHTHKGAIDAINGEFKKINDLNTVPKLSEASALEQAIAHIGANKYMWESAGNEAWVKKHHGNESATFYPSGELVIVNDYLGDYQPVLAYKFDIYAEEPLSRDYVYVNAHTGKVVHTNARIHHHHHAEAAIAPSQGSADTRYSGKRDISTDSNGGGYRLRDYSRGNGVETYNMREGTSYGSAVDFTDNDNNWTSGEYDNSAKDDAALDAHFGAMLTYDYFKEVHNRNSYDDNGAKIKSYVHYRSNYENAFWNGSAMTYGDGGSRFDALTALDVAAHEIGHAVCTHTANLIYDKESGAMNEAFSDIWAAAVEAHFTPEKSPYLIGEDIAKGGGSLRSMSDPNSKRHPDTYKGTYWYSGSADDGGVHTNSGVLNYWFYVLSEGASGTNDNGDNYNVTGISNAKAANIAYRLESVYLSPNSQYKDAREYGIKAAQDLYGVGSNEAIQTQNAFYAVGIGEPYDGNPPTGCTDPISSFPYGESFESDLGKWKQANGDDLNWSRNSGGTPSDGTGPESAADGSYYLYVEASGEGTGYPNKRAILESPCFGLSSLSSPALKFSYHMKGNDMGSLTLEGSTDDGNTWTSLWTKSGSQGDGWNEAEVALSVDIVKLRFNAVTGGGWSSDIAIDKVTVDNGNGGGGGGGNPVYCDSKGGGGYEYIAGVSVGNMNNTSGESDYTDFTSKTAEVASGATITLTPGFSGSSYTEHWSVWIDFNKDGDFEDSDEQVFTGNGSDKVSGTLTIPSSATGTTRMRVSLKYGSTPPSCGNFDGETEDYTVTLGGFYRNGFSAAQEDSFVTDVEVFPNPVVDKVSVVLETASAQKVQVLSLNGTVVLDVPVQQNHRTVDMDLSGLHTGAYLLVIDTDNGQVIQKLFKK